LPEPMDVSTFQTIEFDKCAQPLLQLLKELTGLETTFLTLVDEHLQQWVSTTQSSAALLLPAGMQVAWQDPMCNLKFIEQLTYSTDIPERFTQSLGPRSGMQSFMVLPVSIADKLIGTSAAALSKLALRLQKYLQQQREKLGISGTLSIGIATTVDCPLEELFKAADTALYQSKERGRNTLTVYRPANENTQ
jgi:hypothetical protein